jgi:bifunctional enzyme CysN/CysC
MQDILRFLTCGSVDDGKSTLIGRLLLESDQVFDDQFAEVEKDSARYGTQGGRTDLALLVDGLQAEREQNITIDVAYRFFKTEKRRFVVADTPGHEQYTRNMATGASTSELAVLVVNAERGLQIQTHRHMRIVSLLGIQHIAIAVNKMDLVEWDPHVFQDIVGNLQPLAQELGLKTFQSIPISALNGDNVTKSSCNCTWYTGPTLLEFLEDVDVEKGIAGLEFRMAVQYVTRTNGGFRGYCGRISCGNLRVGDPVRIMPGGSETRIRSIVGWREQRTAAAAGDSVTVCLDDDIDVSRGNVICSAFRAMSVSSQFEARLLGLSEQAIMAGRSYIFYLHTFHAVATMTAIKHKIDVKLGTQLAAKSLLMNDIGVVTLSLDRPVPFEPYDQSRRLGGFILIDRLTNQTVGAGMINFALRRAENIRWQVMDLDKEARARQKFQMPYCLWLTGLPSSGKSTLANLLEKRLYAADRHTYTLDGDNIRHGLNRDLGFSQADRVENIRRVTEVARLLVDAGLIVIVSFISPYRAEREQARASFAPGEFIEIFVDTPLEECERRDPKGLYAKARRGELTNFTGVDSSYEPPLSPEIRLDTIRNTPEECIDQIMSLLQLGDLGECAYSQVAQ